MAGSAGDETYAKNETVLALHGPKLYKAKISKVKPATSDEEAQYYVHYHKWSKKLTLIVAFVRWDEWITAERIKKFSAENEKLQKNLEARYEDEGQRSSLRKPQLPCPLSYHVTFLPANKSKKRQREEVEEEHPSPGMKITLPAELKKRLIDDWEHINRHDREKVKAADNTAISMYGAIHLLRLF
eukprot:1395141-Amorphochlora_amoeboformis.AAC.1